VFEREGDGDFERELRVSEDAVKRPRRNFSLEAIGDTPDFLEAIGHAVDFLQAIADALDSLEEFGHTPDFLRRLVIHRTF
jgi:hypothetical protein